MPTSQPNIILIMTDHFRPDAVGRHTPNLLRLARAGVQFTNAYCASPLCMPSRNCIISGKYPSQTGICGNMAEPFDATARADTFMRHLQAAGYYTALIGKHHYIDSYGLGIDVRTNDEVLRDYGFDHVHQVLDDGENTHNADEYTAYLDRQGLLTEFREVFAREAWRCGTFPFAPEDQADGYIGERGLDFLRDYQEPKPFYLNLSFVGPHPPYWHPGELSIDPDSMPAPIAADDAAQVRRVRAHFMEKCALIDRYIGRLVELLAERGLSEHTTVIFTSDHGDNLGDFGIMDKRFFYEQSAGVPLIMAGAGIEGEQRMAGARVSKQLVSHLDLYPTILGLAGAPRPADRRAGLDIRDLLASPPRAGRREICAELGTATLIHTGNWKLAFDPEEGGVTHLYNLRRDPHELDNLAGVAGYETVSADLIARLLTHRIRLTQYTHAKEEQRVQRVHLQP